MKAVHDSSRTDKTWKSHSAKVKRFLEKLVLTGELVFVPGKPGGSSGGVAARWTLPQKLCAVAGDGFGLKVRHALFGRMQAYRKKSQVRGTCLTFSE